MNVGISPFLAPPVSYLHIYFVAAMIHTNSNWLPFARPMIATRPAKAASWPPIESSMICPRKYQLTNEGLSFIFP